MQCLSVKELINKYFKDNADVDSWSEEKRQMYKKEALWTMFSFLKENNPYFKEAFSEFNWDCMDDFEYDKLPFITKEMLRESPWLLLSVPKAELSLLHVSTGTTGGKPIYIAQTYDDLYTYDLAPQYKSLFNHYSKDDMVFIALPYEMSSSGLAFHRVFQCQEKTIVAPVGKGGHYSLPDKTLDMMIDLNVTVILTTPGYAVLLHEYARKRNINLREVLNLKNIWLTGEGASDALRKRIEELWGCKAYTFYGTLECGSIGMECSAQNGYHINQGHVCVEIVDPVTNRVMGPGEIGEVVVTTYLREGMPLFKYRTQDIGYIDDSPCECGVSSPRLFLRGRLGDQICIEGKEYSPFYFEECLLRNKEVGCWYHLIPHEDFLEICAEPEEGVEISKDLEEKIGSKIEFVTGVPCKFQFVDHIDRSLGKNIRVLQEDKNDN